MIKMQYKLFRGQFLATFEKLMQAQGLNARVAYNISKLAAPLRKAASAAQEEFTAIVANYAIKDEAGEIKPLNGPGTFEVAPENREKWEVAIKVFEEKEATIDRNPFMVGDFFSANLTPLDFEALEPIINDLTADDLRAVASIS